MRYARANVAYEQVMTQMILEDLDPAVIERLELLAKEHGRSLQAELKHIIETVTQHKILLRSHVSLNGILQLTIPTEFKDIDLEVTVMFKPVTPVSKKNPEELGWPVGFFEKTAGSFQDEPLVRYSQGELQERNWDDLSA
jgi:hypothetical protein